MSELILFASAFGTVFCLGFQSLNVNAGHYVFAFLTSLLIGTFNLLLYKFAPQVQTSTELAAYLIAGPVAIVCAMWVHRNVVTPRMKRRAESRAGASAQKD